MPGASYCGNFRELPSSGVQNAKLSKGIVVEPLLLDVVGASNEDDEDSLKAMSRKFDILLVSDMMYDVKLCVHLVRFLFRLMSLNPSLQVIAAGEDRLGASNKEYAAQLKTFGLERNIIKKIPGKLLESWFYPGLGDIILEKLVLSK